MDKFLPDIYQQNIYKINYDKLKKAKIKCLVFDLNNTIAPLEQDTPSRKLKELFEDLKDMGFKIIILSNSSKNRVEPFKEELNVDSAYHAWKPSRKKYKRIQELYHLKDINIACIGDHLVTDVYGANRMGFTSILVNSLSKREFFTTKLYKGIEKIILHHFTKKNLLIKGEYYE